MFVYLSFCLLVYIYLLEMQWGPWPEHVRRFWDHRDHENVTFVFYEDMKKVWFIQNLNTENLRKKQ